MKRNIVIVLITVFALFSETLFEVRDTSNNKVLDVSTDGLRIMNHGDTLMVISSSEIKAVLANNKGLSRSFSVTTSASKGSENNLMRLTSDSTRFWISDTGSGFGVSTNNAAKKGPDLNLLKVSDNTTTMQDSLGGRYTNFSRYNTFIGLNAGKSTVPIYDLNGKNNVFIGNNAGYTNADGANNVFIGNDAGYKSNENFNVFIGFNSGKENVGGMGNTFVGDNSGLFNSWGCSNSVFGSGAGYCNETGSNNSIFGSDAGRGYYYNSYSGNCLFGSSAGNSLRTGGNNVMLGYRAGSSNVSGTGNVFIGKDAGYSETSSNKLYIENSNSTTPLIWGDFANDQLRFNGNVGIGIAPSSTYGLYVDDDIIGGHFNASTSTGTYTRGIRCYSQGGTATNYGIYATASGTGATNYAGYFSGDINVTGTVVKSKDEIKTDHPLDPENKILSHSTVSSSEMLNVYSGNVILDSGGNATVIMPDWFEAYNTEFRYQLTAVGAPAPNIYISKKINTNSFNISGGSSGMEVSWQVTGIRNDNYAKANPVKVVSDKKEKERGYFLTPEVFGKSEEMSIEALYERDVPNVNEK